MFRKKISYHFYAIIAILGWTLAYVYTKLSLQHYTPISIGFLRYFFASLLLIPVLIIGRIRPPHKEDFLWFLASATCGFSLYMVVFNIAMTQVTSATSSVIVATAPIFTAVLAWLLLKEALKLYQWAAVFMQFCGILVLTLINGSFSSNTGVLLLLLCPIMLAIYNLIQKKLTRKYSPLQVTAYSILLGTIMLAVFSPTAFRELKTAPVNQVINILILGIFSSAIAYVAWTQTLSKAPKTSQVTIYMFLIPFLSALTGFLIAGEHLELPTVVGGIVIILGMLLFNKDAVVSKAESDAL